MGIVVDGRTVNTRETALAWHSRGYTVIPCLPASKKAAIPWRRWQTERPEEALVRTWFSDERTNLAVLCRDGLVVLDFDNTTAFTRWLVGHWDVAKTLTVKTSRGFHLYYQVDDPPPHTFAMDGGECKASGYVLAPPSVHPGGVRYEMAVDAPIRRVDRLSEIQERRTRYAGSSSVWLCVSSGRFDSATPSPLHPDHEAVRPTVEADTHNTEHGRRRRPAFLLSIPEIKCRLPITSLLSRYTRLIPSDPTGRWFICRCPNTDHEDKTPSFWVDAYRNLCSCYVPWCKATQPRGLPMDVIGVYAWLHDLSNTEAITRLREELTL